MALPTITKVSSKFGAPMGRGQRYNRPHGTLHCCKVKLDSGGYDAGGAYWGIGAPLWAIWDDDGGVEAYVRAPDRKRAKQTFMLKRGIIACRWYR